MAMFDAYPGGGEDGETDKKCRHCRQTFHDRDVADLAEVLRHYVYEHPESEFLTDVLDGVSVEVECLECERPIDSGLDSGPDYLAVRGYCESCCQGSPMLRLVCQKLSPEEAIEKSGVDGLLPEGFSDADRGPRDGDTIWSPGSSPAAGVNPPRYEHEEFADDYYKWSERGVESPEDEEWSDTFYTCKFCPGRADEPRKINHSLSCPVHE